MRDKKKRKEGERRDDKQERMVGEQHTYMGTVGGRR